MSSPKHPDSNIPNSYEERLAWALSELAGLETSLHRVREALLSLQVTPESSTQASSAADVKSLLAEALPTAAREVVEAPSATPQSSDLTPKATQPEAKKSKERSEGWELSFGVKWFSRLGIVVLLIGLAMAFAYSLPSLPNSLKVLSGLILSLGFFLLGARLMPSAPLLGRIIQGGGVSLGYLSVFAAFFIPTVALFHHSGAGIFCLVVYSILSAFLAHRLRSQAIAVLAVSYGFFIAAYSMAIPDLVTGPLLPLGYGLTWQVAQLIGLVLTVLALLLSVRNTDWRVLSKLTLVQALLLPLFHNYYPSAFWETYLWTVFLLHHGAALFVMSKPDWLLLGMSGVAFYGALWAPIHGLGYVDEKMGHYDLRPHVEYVLGGLYFGSYAIQAYLRPRLASGVMPTGAFRMLVTLGALFVAIGLIRQVDGPLLSLLLAAEALILVLASKYEDEQTQSLRVVLSSVAYLLMFVALIVTSLVYPVTAIMETISSAKRFSYFVSSMGVSLVAVAIEALTHRRYPVAAALLLVYTSMALFVTVATWAEKTGVTLSFVGCGLVMLTLGFMWRRKLYRILGIVWLLIATFCLFAIDMDSMAMPSRILAFLALGAVMLGASYGYTRLLNAQAATPPETPPRE